MGLPEAHNIGGMNARLSKADGIKKERGMSLGSDEI